LKAAREKQYHKANTLIDKAIKLQPKEPKFYGLKGDLALQDKHFERAVGLYSKAISLYPDYFAFHLQQGVAKKELGDVKGAVKSLQASNALLPTPNAHKALGDIALITGDRAGALKHYSTAASSQSPVGQAAGVSMARLELESNPGKYFGTRLGMNQQGTVSILIQNRSPVTVGGVEVVTAYFDERGNQLSKANTIRVRGELAPGAQTTVTTQLTQGNGLRAIVNKARILEK